MTGPSPRDETLESALERVRRSPEDPSTYGRAGDLLYQAGRPEEALEYYRQLTRLDPGDARGWLAAGIAAHAAGDLAGAQEWMARAAAFPSIEGEARASLALVLAERHQYEDALKEAHAALALPLDHPKRPARLHTVIGYCCECLGKPALATTHYRRALRLDPEDAYTHLALAGLLARSGGSKQAKAALSRALRHSPSNATFLRQIATAARKMGVSRTAVAALHRARQLRPEDPEIEADLAEVLLAAGSTKAAVDTAGSALVLPAGAVVRSRMHAVVAYGQDVMGNEAAALASWQRAVAEDPGNRTARFNLGALYFRTERFAEAIEHLESARTIDPGDLECAEWLAQSYMETGDADRASPLLLRLLERGRPHPALTLLVEAFDQQGNGDGAVRMAREAVAERPEQAGGWVALAHALHLAGDRPAASEAAGKARSLDPEDPWVRWIWSRTGDPTTPEPVSGEE